MFLQSLKTYTYILEDISLKRRTMVMVKSTTTMVGNDVEALGHCELTMTLMVNHEAHELTTTKVNLP